MAPAFTGQLLIKVHHALVFHLPGLHRKQQTSSVPFSLQSSQSAVVPSGVYNMVMMSRTGHSLSWMSCMFGLKKSTAVKACKGYYTP